MGPCVRLIRALVAQPQPELTEEESEKYWGEFKAAVKGEGWMFSEVRIRRAEGLRQWKENEDACCKARVGKILKPYIVDDENTLAGKATITYDDGNTEEGEVVYHKLWGPTFGVDTTILTRNKDIRLHHHSYPSPLVRGTSITTDADGTRSLASVVVVSPPAR